MLQSSETQTLAFFGEEEDVVVFHVRLPLVLLDHLFLEQNMDEMSFRDKRYCVLAMI